MNIQALQTLEFDKIVQRIKEFALSESGKKLVDALHPSDHIDRIKNQLVETTEAKAIIMKTSAVPIQDLIGIENILEKLGKGTALHPEELGTLSKLLKSTKKMKKFMEDHKSLAPKISQYASSMYELSEVIEAIDKCIVNNTVDDRASVTLEKVRKKIYVAEGRIKSKLASIMSSNTYKKYLQDTNISIKNDHYVISVKSEYRKEISGNVIDKSATGSTLFIEPDAVGALQGELTMLRFDEEKEIYQILLYLTMMVESCLREININIETLAFYDFVFAKAKYSKAIEGCSVDVNLKGYTKIIGGKHPFLGSTCVPLHFEIGQDYKALVITGPNTGGKTVALKTVGLFTAMVQSGLHVPVEEGSIFSIFSDILVDIGDGQSIEQSLSTFSSHVKNIIEIIKCASKYTLVILDEIGAGTDPTEGEGLAIAVLESLYEKGSTIIATSHYAEVKAFAAQAEGFINGSMTFDIGTLKPLYHLSIGTAGESNAFIIALRLGMSQKIIEKAHQITYKEAKDYSTYMDPSRKTNIPEGNAYKKAQPPKSTVIETTDTTSENETVFKVGDLVYVHTLKQRGLIYAEENKKGEVGIVVRDKKLLVQKKRVSLYIDGKQLYPEDYDFDIVFK
ncbi:MAG: hypothetical protein H7X94_07290, partial [Vallitaleaceae bacterium]|nr:hypothetical protein [Vallitaleaceae bacterium]